jgi:hypothetical protein
VLGIALVHLGIDWLDRVNVAAWLENNLATRQ